MGRQTFLAKHPFRSGRVSPFGLLLAVLLALAIVWGWQASTVGADAQRAAGAPISQGPERREQVQLENEADPGAELTGIERRPAPRDDPGAKGNVGIEPQVEEESTREPLARLSDEPDIPAPPPQEDEPEEPPIHSITGVLVSDSGAFRGSAQALVQGLHLDLVGRSSPDVRQEAKLQPILGENGALQRIEFRFDELPSEEFELTLSSLDAHEWYPSSLLVIAPAADVEFRCLDGQDTVALRFEVVDAATKEAVEGWSVRQFRSSVSAENGVLMHAGPLDLAAFPRNSSLQWIVEAPGYAPAMGTELSFRPDPNTGDWMTRVELEVGYRVRLVALAPAPELQPAAGAQVFLDGKSAGFTDGQGQLIIARDSAPKKAKVTWKELSKEGAFEEVCMERPNALVVTILR